MIIAEDDRQLVIANNRQTCAPSVNTVKLSCVKLLRLQALKFPSVFLLFLSFLMLEQFWGCTCASLPLLRMSDSKTLFSSGLLLESVVDDGISESEG